MRARMLPAIALALLPGAGLAMGQPPPPAGAQAEDRAFVAEDAARLVRDAEAFAAAIHGGDLAGAQALYTPLRRHHERMALMAALFADPAPPAFNGFHALEYGLWVETSTEPLQDLAGRLLADATALQTHLGLPAPSPRRLAQGAALLMANLADTGGAAGEDQPSGGDLWQFDASIEAVRAITDLLQPLAETDLAARLAANLAEAAALLRPYRVPGRGFLPFETLTPTDRSLLATSAARLAEDLSTLADRVGRED